MKNAWFLFVCIFFYNFQDLLSAEIKKSNYARQKRLNRGRQSHGERVHLGVHTPLSVYIILRLSAATICVFSWASWAWDNKRAHSLGDIPPSNNTRGCEPLMKRAATIIQSHHVSARRIQTQQPHRWTPADRAAACLLVTVRRPATCLLFN